MLLILSHLLAFAALCIGSFYDVFSDKGDVPDLPAVIGIIGGIVLHSIYAFQLSSFEPVIWMVGVGLAFSVYGWLAYWKGLWGGADAMALTALGFAAPFSVSGPDLIYPVNIFVNMMIVGLVYTIGFAVYHAAGSEEFIGKVRDRVLGEKLRILVEIIGAVLFSIYSGSVGLNPYIYFVGLVFIIFLYRFLKVLEESEMTDTVDVEDLEGGEVVADQGDLIEGISEEEIEDLEVDEVEVKKGIRFMPVFPATLLITDLFGGGVMLLLSIF